MNCPCCNHQLYMYGGQFLSNNGLATFGQCCNTACDLSGKDIKFMLKNGKRFIENENNFEEEED
jgi:hypothetical protein